MVKKVLPFNVRKWDLGHGSIIRKRCSLQSKITVGIFLVLAALLVAVVVVCIIGSRQRKDYWLPTYTSPSELGVYENAAVSTDAAACMPIARDMLKRGGSAVDAAIAALLCMGAVNPQSMGIGGGFLMTVYKRDKGEAHFIDARETAPRNANEDMFQGNSTLSEIGPLSIAVPGELAGYEAAHKKFGVLEWGELFQPTIQMCRNGIAVTRHLHKYLHKYEDKIKEREAMRRIFVNNRTGQVYKEGDVIVRDDLASTLDTISKDGAKALYDPSHPLGAKFFQDLRNMGSVIQESDLREYRPRSTPPVRTRLRNNDTIFSSPIPGGGSVLLFILNVLDGYGFSEATSEDKTSSVLYLHRIAEAFKFAYAKRRELEDDLEFMKPLVDNMTSRDYADAIRQLINDSTTFQDLWYYGYKNDTELLNDHGTAHLSLIAPNGDAVSVTSTVNIYFGSLEMSPSTGILLNDEMDDFSVPSIVSYFGVPPYARNRIAPGKRPMSSMCPTIVVSPDGNVQLAIGGNGGTKIPTAVLQVMTRNLWLGEDIKQAIDAPRFHHQLLPDILYYENKFRKDLLVELQKKGHKLEDFGRQGMSGIVLAVARGKDGRLYANSDYRKGGDVGGF